MIKHLTQKLNIHAKIALVFLSSGLLTLGTLYTPQISDYSRHQFLVFICAQAIIIVVAPFLLKIQLFRRWYGWTDAMSDEQKLVISKGAILDYYKISYENKYITRVFPYFSRTCATGFVLGFMGDMVRLVGAEYIGWIGQLCFYPLFLSLIIATTVPFFHRFKYGAK
ncbi:MAG: hypothetical protein LWW76_01345 [Burkholderiales bacterium]|jgi:hypothetical protein|nr:hypothetical protein [Burkholderiales bacterium]